MIYFQTKKKERGQGFIAINVPRYPAELEAYYNIRKSIFCEEQQLFKTSDYDEKDAHAIPIIAVNHYCGSPDDIVGVVRIYEACNREWFGGRLGVVKAYRTFSKYICPNLFKDHQVSSLYKMSIAAGLIYRAVSLANYIGCDKFSAYVQVQNVKLFERLHWSVVATTTFNGVPHMLMEADLDAYPATPIYDGLGTDAIGVLSDLNVA